MDQDNLQFIWQEILSDIATPAGWWQLAIVVVACSVAWAINGALRAYVMRNAPEHWKVGIGGINRVLFPLSTLIFVLFGELAIRSWHHTSLLVLASKLLIAMAAIRLIVYAVRYTSQPSGMLKALESTISGFIWLILALHLSGILPGILNTLETIEFTIGKSKINLLVGLQGLLTVLVTIFIAMWFSRVLENKLMRIDDVNMNLRVVLSKLLRILLIFIALLIALSAVGLDITMLSVFGGALAVGLGFGLQRIASNYVSGFIILLDKSMQIGDVLTIDMHYGVVSDLRTRYLVLRKLDGTQVIIPNEMLIINPVINHSFTDHKARVQMPIQVSYDSDLELAMKLMFDIAQDHPRVLVEPPQTVHVKGFGESGIDLMLTVWIPDPEEGSAALQSEINLKIWQAFKANNISIPFPQREVRILNAQESTVDAGLKKET
ncbi:MAG: mechanosensitive ion channel protein MscS [Methylotenera sp. 24-45-7]|nr:MAG: mechanosensitive ion channel protein MscS [Mehylophilales bacterium 35-46-6]OYZ39735.1 MAG: mechanosensitive ion channel protein MscS [Methylotenera sp. 24-45-7]OZA08125.1 MAG: mechanosensitive ion channel protein MscS [Methylotenera sp. 17-45-7]OZA54148.1 MAG: mechanosensitive ion channel protein MscS [Methylophilales bacterium 39-45-7]HQS43711.1 mechanosensitive ion channel [Methylotenera sp.]